MRIRYAFDVACYLVDNTPLRTDERRERKLLQLVTGFNVFGPLMERQAA